MTARKAAHSLQRAKGALASGFATVDLHHATGHDPCSFTCLEARWLRAISPPRFSRTIEAAKCSFVDMCHMSMAWSWAQSMCSAHSPIKAVPLPALAGEGGLRSATYIPLQGLSW